MFTLMGLILRENDRGETSKSVTVLTAEKGFIDVFVRGGKKSTKNSSPTQLFAYSKLCLDEKKNSKNQSVYYLNSCESDKLFYNLRLDAKRMALASYFSELLMYIRTEDASCGEILRLALNTLYFLNEGEKDMELLKSIFEFRLLCEAGFRPALLGCSVCMTYEADIMHFNLSTGMLECDKCCYNPDSIYDIELDKTMLYIIRFIALTEYKRLFAFKISEKYQKKLTAFTERFVKYNLKGKFPTLDFYKLL